MVWATAGRVAVGYIAGKVKKGENTSTEKNVEKQPKKQPEQAQTGSGRKTVINNYFKGKKKQKNIEKILPEKIDVREHNIQDLMPEKIKKKEHRLRDLINLI